MDKRFAGLMFVFFLTFALFASMIIFRGTLSTRAKEALVPSGDASLLFVFPLEVASNGNAAINIFIRDAATKPVANKTIAISTTKGVVTPAVVTTDADGKATAVLTCTTNGIAQLSAIIDSTIPLKQQVSIKCN